MPLKICKLIQWHPFLDARIFKKEAKSLVRHGYEVTMIAPKRNGYLFDIDGTPFTDRFLEQKFVHDGVTIITYDQTMPSWSEMQSALRVNGQLPSTNPLVSLGIAQDADVFHAHEFFSLYAGVCIKRALRAKGKEVKLVYDSHEVYPDPYSNMSERSIKRLHEMLLNMIPDIDVIITVSDSMKAWYLSINPEIEAEVIYNSPPLAPEPTPKAYPNNQLVVCYEGIMGFHKGNAATIIQITEECNKHFDFTFKIIGGMINGHKLELPAQIKDKVRFTGWVPYNSIPTHMEEVDVGWIDYKYPHMLNHQLALPNKFFSLLNNSVPVVVNKCHEMETLIRRHQCGLVIDKKLPSSTDYTNAFRYLFEHQDVMRQMSMNARKMMKEIYCWELMEKRLLSLYERLENPGSVLFLR